MAEAKLNVLIKLRDEASRQMGQASQKFRQHSKAIRIAALAAGAAIVGMGIKSVKTFAKMGDEVQKMALRTGFSTEALSELRFAAEQSGASLGMLEKAVKRQSKAIVDATDGMTTYVRAFDRIGLSAEDLIKLKPEEAFFRIASAIAELESDTVRASAAQDLFGRAGTQLLPLFDAGATGIARLRQEAHNLGIVFDTEAANSAARLTDAMNSLKQSINGLQIAFAEKLAPTISKWAEDLAQTISQLDEMAEGLATFQRSISTTGTTTREYLQAVEELMKAQRGESNILTELVLKHPRLAKALDIQTEFMKLLEERTRLSEMAGHNWMLEQTEMTKAAELTSIALEKQKVAMEQLSVTQRIVAIQAQEIARRQAEMFRRYALGLAGMRDIWAGVGGGGGRGGGGGGALGRQGPAGLLNAYITMYGKTIGTQQFIHDYGIGGIRGAVGGPGATTGGRDVPPPIGRGPLPPTEESSAEPSSIRGDIVIQNTIVLDDEKIGESLSRILGASTMSRSRMGG